MPYATPTRFLKGVSTSAKNTVLGNYMSPNQLDPHEYVNDFDTYAAADWTITTTTGTNALVAGNGGILRLSTAATSSDIQHIAKNPAAFNIVPGNQMWFLVSINLNDNVSGFIAGLQAGGTAFAPVDGIYFSKVTGSANVDFTIRRASTSTTLSAVTTIGAATQTSFGFYYDGKQNPTIYVFSATPSIAGAAQTAFGQPYFIGGVMVGSIGAESPTSTSLANLPLAATGLTQAVGIQAGAAAIKTLDCDFLMAATEQLRY
jgi:hypothetical protein